MAEEMYLEARVAGYEPDEEDMAILAESLGEDYSEEIIGIWEGHRTSPDAGHDHRWEFKEDGTYIYYDVKDGENWVPSGDELNAYFVVGNLLVTYWVKDGMETAKWSEITIDGDTMNLMALSENEEGKTDTETFEMKRVAE